LPGTYQCNDAKRRIADEAPSRAACGLPETGFVFCCFNNNYKIAPAIFAIWMRLLAQVESSVLWLLADNPAAMRNLRVCAQAHGIASERLIFAERTSLEQHLARHARADLFLDTLPYGAHTTASDALWAGLPVLTCLGESFAGRVGASLLHAAGLPELVAPDRAAYEARALQYARDPIALAAIRERLIHNRGDCALFDTARFTRHLEAAYGAMMARLRGGEPPQAFAVAPIP
jgi:predicted O-linked N-acetylglucosamine transferase (SPINDLY family)